MSPALPTAASSTATPIGWGKRPISGPSHARCARAPPPGRWSTSTARDPPRDMAHLRPAAAGLVLLSLLAACARPPDRLTLMPASFDALPGWQQDDQGVALAALDRSCALVLLPTRPSDASLGAGGVAGTVADWRRPRPPPAPPPPPPPAAPPPAFPAAVPPPPAPPTHTPPPPSPPPFHAHPRRAAPPPPAPPPP